MAAAIESTRPVEIANLVRMGFFTFAPEAPQSVDSGREVYLPRPLEVAAASGGGYSAGIGTARRVAGLMALSYWSIAVLEGPGQSVSCHVE